VFVSLVGFVATRPQRVAAGRLQRPPRSPIGSGSTGNLPTWLTVTPRLVLASASPARLRVLQWAGLRPEVMVSGADEDGLDSVAVVERVVQLARRKARAVAARLEPIDRVLIIGCDSLLEFEGRAEGKPSSPAEAAALWRRMRTRTGFLHTGHCLIDAARGAEATATDTALIRFGDPTDAEIDAYVATGEPLQVAGAFTLEGFGAAWIDSIDGNYGTITGLSIPVLRRLLGQLGVELVGLWATPGRPDLAASNPDVTR
jgi:septum formation protein